MRDLDFVCFFIKLTVIFFLVYPRSPKWEGVYCFTYVRLFVRPSFRLSFRPFVCPSVLPSVQYIFRRIFLSNC